MRVTVRLPRAPRQWLRRLAMAVGIVPLGLAFAIAHAADGPAFTCPPVPQPFAQAEATAGMAAAPDRGALFRIEKAGRVSWLYGTVHTARRAWIFPGPETRRALAGVDRLAVELDLSDPAILADVMASMKDTSGLSPLPPSLNARLAAQARVACLGAEYASLRPDDQAVGLVILAGRAAGLDPAYGIDMALAGYARSLGKPITSLETVQQQMDFLRPKDAAELEARVGEALDALEKDEVAMGLAAMAEAWAAGRLGELERLGRENDTPALRSIDDLAMARRNRVMADHIAAIHNDGHPVLAAVGALHLVGAQALPALLADRGFQVTRVRFASAPADVPANAPADAPP